MSLPCATTPFPSRKRSGRWPVNTTGMVLAVSVTRKRTVSASFSRTTLPASTSPPRRKARPIGASWEATWLGVKKNTRFDWNAFSTSAAAIPSAASPDTIQIARLVLGFKLTFLLDAAQRLRAAHAQPRDFHDDRQCSHAVRHPDIEIVIHRARNLINPVPSACAARARG